MRRVIDYGQERAEFDVEADRLLGRLEAIGDDLEPAAALLNALDQPFHFPPFPRVLTPGDRITVVVDESLQNLVSLLVPLLEQITAVGIQPADITLLCAPTGSTQPWIDELPEELEEIQLELHDPRDRKKLSYLATSKAGRRLYLNRTLVDADQAVILSARRYDALLGLGGAEGAIFPALSDEETRKAFDNQVRLSAPGGVPWPVRKEAMEAAWLLGLPFFVQVIEGAGDRLAAIVAGAAEATAEGERLLDRRWRQTVSRPAQIVVAGISGDPTRHTFADLAAAAACAARVVQPNGRIVLLSRATPTMGKDVDLLRGCDEAEEALVQLRREPSQERVAAMRWAAAASHARLYLLSGLEQQLVEDLWATPLADASQVQRLLYAGGDAIFLDDAHRALALVEKATEG